MQRFPRLFSHDPAILFFWSTSSVLPSRCQIHLLYTLHHHTHFVLWGRSPASSLRSRQLSQPIKESLRGSWVVQGRESVMPSTRNYLQELIAGLVFRVPRFEMLMCDLRCCGGWSTCVTSFDQQWRYDSCWRPIFGGDRSSRHSRAQFPVHS